RSAMIQSYLLYSNSLKVGVSRHIGTGGLRDHTGIRLNCSIPDVGQLRLWAVHAHPLAGAERRLHDLHRPFTPRWPVWVGQWPFVSERWKALTGHLPSLPRFAPMSGPKPVAAVQLWQLVDASDP